MLVRRESNNFDLFRIVTGIGVVLLHCDLLTRYPELDFIEPDIIAQLPPLVPTFFVLSSYLVIASLERAKSLKRYATLRARRILPAYVCVVLLFGLLLPATGSRLPYLAANLSTLNFLAPTLPGVFTSNPDPNVNGSLWTIKIEIMFYALLPLLVWLGRKWSPTLVWGGIYVLSVSYWEICEYLLGSTGQPIFFTLARQLPGWIAYMAVGALVHYHRELFKRWMIPLLALCACAIYAGALASYNPATPAVTGILTMAFCLGPYLGPWGKYGDFSYGLYLYHYPIIQCLIATGYAKDQPWLFLVTALALSLGAGVTSWHLVEKRFLRRTRASTEATKGCEPPRSVDSPAR